MQEGKTYEHTNENGFQTDAALQEWNVQFTVMWIKIHFSYI